LRSLLDYAFVGGGVYGLINICKISIWFCGERKLGFYAFMVLTLHLFSLLKYLGRAAHEIDFQVDG
jgi:hypothetical protein